MFRSNSGPAPSSPDPCAPSVLIVEQSDESRDVLRTALERRGVTILEAAEARAGLDLLRQHHPNVAVLDLEADWADDEAIRAGYDGQQDSSLVVLGTARRPNACLPDDRVVRKPYHFAPLIRTIEGLLAQADPASGK